MTRIEAESLCNEFFKLETAFLVEFWSHILQRINKTSKSLQNPAIDIQTLILLQRSLITFFEKLRNEDTFNDFEEKAKALLVDRCSELNKNLEFIYNCYEKRTRKRNTKYDSGNASDTIFDNRDNFRVSCFYVTLDAILVDLRSKTNAFEENLKPFIFLTDMEKLTDGELRTQAENLRKIYRIDLDDGNYFLFLPNN